MTLVAPTSTEHPYRAGGDAAPVIAQLEDALAVYVANCRSSRAPTPVRCLANAKDFWPAARRLDARVEWKHPRHPTFYVLVPGGYVAVELADHVVEGHLEFSTEYA